MKTSYLNKTFHFTSKELNQVRAFYSKRKSNLNTIIQEFSEINYSTYDIFLTHRYTDKELVEVLFLELKASTYDVYVDWYDPFLDRENISEKSAEIIRSSIEKSKCLIYVTPVTDSTSKWMPWECGYMAGYSGNVAILPVLDEPNGKFEGEEFLSLYPLIKKGEDDKLYVIFSNGRTILFDDWIDKIPVKAEAFNLNYTIEEIKQEEILLQGIGTTNLKNNVQFLKLR